MACTLAGELGVQHLLLDNDELAIPGYAENPTNRCYFCKNSLYDVCRAQAARLGITAIVDGVNLDDLGDYRPGLKAAAEQGKQGLKVERLRTLWPELPA